MRQLEAINQPTVGGRGFRLVVMTSGRFWAGYPHDPSIRTGSKAACRPRLLAAKNRHRNKCQFSGTGAIMHPVKWFFARIWSGNPYQNSLSKTYPALTTCAFLDQDLRKIRQRKRGMKWLAK